MYNLIMSSISPTPVQSFRGVKLINNGVRVLLGLIQHHAMITNCPDCFIREYYLSLNQTFLWFRGFPFCLSTGYRKVAYIIVISCFDPCSESGHRYKMVKVLKL